MGIANFLGALLKKRGERWGQGGLFCSVLFLRRGKSSYAGMVTGMIQEINDAGQEGEAAGGRSLKRQEGV